MIKYIITTLALVGFTLVNPIKAQSPTQTIKGTVIDKQAQSSLPGVNIVVLGSNPIKGTSTDMDGKFKLTDMAPGRYDLKITFLGYKEIVLPNVQVTSGKEVSLDIGLEESVNALNEVVVSGTKKK